MICYWVRAVIREETEEEEEEKGRGGEGKERLEGLEKFIQNLTTNFWGN